MSLCSTLFVVSWPLPLAVVNTRDNGIQQTV